MTSDDVFTTHAGEIGPELTNQEIRLRLSHTCGGDWLRSEIVAGFQSSLPHMRGRLGLPNKKKRKKHVFTTHAGEAG